MSDGLSVIIPCYRESGSLRRCLAGLAPDRQQAQFETIVVNSGSDDSVASVAAGLASVRTVSTPQRLWAGAARNVGVRAARGAFLLFLDADCVPEPGWVEAARTALETGVRMAGGPVLDLLPNHPIATSDNLLQFSEYPAGRPGGPATKFPSCNLAMRRADFDALGGFPEELPAAEDTRLAQAAVRLWPDGLHFVPGMRVRHLGRTTLRQFLAHHAWFGYHRGLLGLDLTPRQKGLAARTVMLPAVVFWRLRYILGRTRAWNAGGLPRALLLSPLLVAGLSAYAIGLRLGLLEARTGGAGR
jgi:glycosyltransferase involved in cell wall biosynthesis